MTFYVSLALEDSYVSTTKHHPDCIECDTVEEALAAIEEYDWENEANQLHLSRCRDTASKLAEITEELKGI